MRIILSQKNQKSCTHYGHCYTSWMKGYKCPFTCIQREKVLSRHADSSRLRTNLCLPQSSSISKHKPSCNTHCQVQDFVPARKTLANARLSESAICWNRRQPLKPLFKTQEKHRLWLLPKKTNQGRGNVTYKKVLSDRTETLNTTEITTVIILHAAPAACCVSKNTACVP